jgi:hypothetical protein
LSNFRPASHDEIKAAIINSSDATCSIDFIPTKLLKSCLDALLPPITTLVNMCLEGSIFPTRFKTALVTPQLKKHSLPKEDLSSYRPISNLNFLSKILERIMYNRLVEHLATFPALSQFQSAYRKFHSVETALVRIQNDLLTAIDKKQVTALVLLDLSAAFDTLDHKILLSRLTSNFGISHSALDLLTSYLTDRTQSVTINSHTTAPSGLCTGVPQGSVLGPLLFSLYTTPLSYLLTDSKMPFHLYADDTQLYVSFAAHDSTSSLASLSSTLDSVHNWLSANRLFVNPSKTEYLLIGTKQQRSKISSSSLLFAGNIISPSTSVRNLGVTFDSDLSLTTHISSVCKSSHFIVRQIRQVRPSLDINSSILLANALVSSKLDFCNSLYFGLPQSSLHRLQLIQNAAARAIFPSLRRHDHISPILRKLHWLPVNQRITYKIAVLTFKILHNNQPSYLSDLLCEHVPMRHLRSSGKFLLAVPRVTSANGRRSFSYAAPTVWNSLPQSLRATTSFSFFCSHLKTHLFPP